MEYDDAVKGVSAVLRGWLQNLARNAAGEGYTLEPEVVVGALLTLKKEYEQLIGEPEWDVLDNWLDDGRGTE